MSKKFLDGKQELGLKKARKIEPVLGYHITRAFISGRWGHNWVEAWVSPYDSYLINVKTKDFTACIINGKQVEKPIWRRRGCCA